MYVVNGHCIQYLFSSNERHASAGQSLNDHILFMEKQNPQINKRTRIIIQSIQSVDCRVVRLILIFFFFLWWLLLCIIYALRAGWRHDERNKVNEFDKQFFFVIYQNSFSIFYELIHSIEIE